MKSSPSIFKKSSVPRINWSLPSNESSNDILPPPGRNIFEKVTSLPVTANEAISRGCTALSARSPCADVANEEV